MSILSWPFRIVFHLAEFLFALIMRLILVIVGLAFLAAGMVLTITIVGALIGIPLVIVGCLLIVRSIF